METSITETVNANTVSEITDEFFTSTSDGLIDSGGITKTMNDGVLTSTMTTTFSPQKLVIPTSLTPGQSVTNSYTETDVTTPSGGASTTDMTAVSETLTLASSTSTVTVPAGSYTAYELHDTETDTDTTSGGTASTSTTEDYFASGTGLVQAVSGPLSAPTGTLQLVSTDITSGGGGGGGGGGGAVTGTGIAPTIVKSTVPTAVVAGAKLHATLRLNLTDALATSEKGYTVRVYASTSSTLDTATDPLVTSVVKTSTIKAAKTAPLTIPITTLPASLANGTYYLNIQTTDSAGNTDSATLGTTVTVAAPFVALSETVTSPFTTALVGGAKGKGSVRVAITNSGNVASTGITPINLTFSTTTGVIGTSFATLNKKLNIPVGKTVTVAVPVKSIPVLANGSYYVVAQVTDPKGGITVASSTSTTTIAAPFVVLTASLAVTNIKAGVTIVVTNTGNVVDLTHLTGTFTVTTDVAGLDPVGASISLTSARVNIQPNKSIKLHLKPTKASLAGLLTGVPYYLKLSFSDDTGNSGIAITSTPFTL